MLRLLPGGLVLAALLGPASACRSSQVSAPRGAGPADFPPVDTSLAAPAAPGAAVSGGTSILSHLFDPPPASADLASDGDADADFQVVVAALFSQFVGDWDVALVDYQPDGATRTRHGEWQFGWIL